MLSFDVAKARTALFYLGKANRKLKDREIARQKVKLAINRLKKISTTNIKKDLAELERRIAQALAMEKRVTGVTRDDEAEHNELIDKIDALQLKLAKYMDTSDAREKRIRELEHKILKSTQPKLYEMVMLKEGLVDLEREYQEEKQSGQHKPDDLKQIDKKIKRLRKRLKELENQR